MREREQEGPGETHQLIVAEARQRGAHPDKDEQQDRIFAANQNSAIRIVFATGTKSDSAKMAAIPRNTSAVAGSVNLSMRRAGFRP